MFVQRITAWVSRLATSVSSRVRRPAMAPSPRQAVLTAAGCDHDQRPFSTGSASGRWLDDARRLRPHVGPPPLQAQRWSGRPTISGPLGGIRQERAPQLPPRPLPAPATPPQVPTPEPTGRTQPLPPPSGAPASHDTAELELDQNLQRRLRSLRFLVRHGVYNEGFPAGKAPEQYHYSLGLDPLDGE